jgi:hypothetical protein
VGVKQSPLKRKIVEQGYQYCQIATDTWDDVRRELQAYGENWVFRGQAEDTWPLTTSLERESFDVPRDFAEQKMLTDIRRRAHHFLSPVHLPQTTIEWLALMQHHGAPTRLLDWTRSPFVALYFAIENVKPLHRCAVWCLNQAWCLEKSRQVIHSKNKSLLAMFDPSDPTVFDDHVLNGGHRLVVPVEPFRQHERLTIQQGMFTCPGDVDASFMENLSGLDPGPDERLVQITIPGNLRGHALHELNQSNINRASLFPGIDGLVQSLKFKLAQPTPVQRAIGQLGVR